MRIAAYSINGINGRLTTLLVPTAYRMTLVQVSRPHNIVCLGRPGEMVWL